MRCCSPYKAAQIGRVIYVGRIAVNFGGEQVMTREGNAYTNGRPTYLSPDDGSGNYFQIASNGTNWIAVRYVSGSPTSPQLGPHHNQQPLGTFGTLTIYQP